MIRLRLLWPPRIAYTAPHDGGGHDCKGRRYGAYHWLLVSLGHYHVRLWPRHCARTFVSAYVKTGTLPGDQWRQR